MKQQKAMSTQFVTEPDVLVVTDEAPNVQVGIMGGTFNPPHNAHLLMAEQVREQLDLDKILFMPDNIPPHADAKKAISAHHRQAMLELAIEDNPLFELETIELERGGKSYSYETILELKERHPNWDLFFIIGGDMVAYLPKWHEIDALVHEVQFVGVCRTGFDKQTPYPVLWVDVPVVSFSSTTIRSKLALGQSVRYMVPDKVRAYMKKEGLYQNV